MELILSAISAGGLIGASNQYMCLLLVSIAARFGLITLAKPVEFMEEWWFIGIVALFWLLTVAPAYATVLGPGVMNAINAIINFISGFLVPLSGALLSLAAAGVISMDPELRNLLMTIRLFNPDGSLGAQGYIVAGGGALLASALSGMRFLAKPGLSSATSTMGTFAAPIYTTTENIASAVLLGLFFLLIQINPWLAVLLVLSIILLILGILVFAIHQLWRLNRGIGKVFRLFKLWPRAGIAVVAEALIWGLGWIVLRNWQHGVTRLIKWALWLAAVLLLLGPLLPVAVVVLVLGIYRGGLRGAGVLLGNIEGKGGLELSRYSFV
ncbi:MAG: DUF4126 family protein [Anaerolineae bacterium]|nr:DUF4126 family protein [Anaerolineae bacterium]MDW8101708.1 DUF4126 family protein [Anaerolineae bacterium]